MILTFKENEKQILFCLLLCERYLQTEQEKKPNTKKENKGTQPRKPDDVLLGTRMKKLEEDLEEAKREKTRLKCVVHILIYKQYYKDIFPAFVNVLVNS